VKPTSIDINEGTYTFICGPTGSGKTTLLAILAGILSPSAGEIVFDTIRFSERDDKSVSRFREQHIGYVPQATLFIPELTVWENILSKKVEIISTRSCRAAWIGRQDTHAALRALRR